MATLDAAPARDVMEMEPFLKSEELVSENAAGESPAIANSAESAKGEINDFLSSVQKNIRFTIRTLEPLLGAVAVSLTVLQWWFFNIAVIIINKWIFQEFKFTFPMTLTCVHFLVSWIGAYISIHVLKLSPLIEVKADDRLARIFPLASVTCVNIVLGNVSLRYIPVSFVQTIKALTPATTVLLQVLVWGKSFHKLVYWSLVPVVGGMVLASFTELSFVLAGFLAAIASCFITSTSGILAEHLLSGKYKFDSINTVFHMVPYGLQLLILPALAIEGSSVYTWLIHAEDLWWPIVAIVTSGVMAFGLNFSLYAVIKVTSAVTFNVVGNFKVAVAVLCSWLVFRNPMNLLNILGCAVTVGGCTYYGYLQHYFSQQAKVTAAASAAVAATVAAHKPSDM